MVHSTLLTGMTYVFVYDRAVMELYTSLPPSGLGQRYSGFCFSRRPVTVLAPQSTRLHTHSADRSISHDTGHGFDA